MKPCPFCGNNIDIDDPDTLHKTGTIWIDGLHDGRSYHHFKTDTKGLENGFCWEINCTTSSSGCGVNISADSKQEVIAKWQRRAYDRS